MDDWSEFSRTPVIRPPVDPNAAVPMVTASVFDVQSDIIWVGDSTGFIASYVDNMLAPYTRFQAHLKPVKQVLAHPKGVLTSDGDTIKLTNRRGLVEHLYTVKEHAELTDIQKLAYITPTEILVVTGTLLIRFDISKNVLKIIMPYTANVILISSNKRYIVLGKENGTVDIFDHIDNKILKTFNCHSTTLSDMDLKENRLAVCGFSKRHGNYVADPMVHVYDLKTLSALSPIPFPTGAAFVRLHPKLSTLAMISSVSGQMQVIDTTKPGSFQLFQVENCPSILSFELSSTGDYLSIIDGYSVLHLWCHSPEHSRMSNRAPISYPEQEPLPLMVTNIDDEEIPLNSIGLPYYKDQLLSSWPSHAIFRSAGTPTKKIDPEIYKNSETIGNITVAAYDREKYGRRNQQKKYVSIADSSDKKFLSNKNNQLNSRLTNKKKEINIFEYKTGASNSTPPAFKKLEIFYSKFGVDDFDFDSFNQTMFAGLESHVDNSYTNSLLQLYRFVPEVFSFLIENLAIEDFEPNSLLRELGYLYDMLVKSHGKNFRPTNFQHALSNIPEAKELGLLEKEDGAHHNSNIHSDNASKLQLFNRFLFDRIYQDEVRLKSGENSKSGLNFDKIFGIEVETTLRSMYGNLIGRETHIVHTLEVSFMRPSPHHSLKPNQSIITHIEASMSRMEQKPLMNERTGNYEMVKQSQAVTQLPPVLSVSLHLSNSDKKQIRNMKDWLRPRFQTGLSKQGLILTDTVRSSSSSSSASAAPSGFFKEYELVGFVAEISGDTEKDKHLVTFVQIEDEVTHRKTWHLFNDFLVIEIPESEVLNLSYWWKTPVTLVYRDVAYPTKFNEMCWRNGLNDEILYRDHFAAAIRESTKIEYKLLTRAEAPHPGSLVAIDTEFVIIEQEQFEIKSNGARLLLKPSTHALARVSILRGNDGDKFGVPFIDDYVVVKEPVQDYLTSYSGIEPGDLDPEASDKPLVTGEVAYRKIWLLLNLGCVFVGHGLTKDFRTINICVPKSQIRDTSVFFYKGQRILSLRFLAYILLEKEVQLGNHDSIEDAMTALLIFKEYERLKETGMFEEVLDYIYREGQAMKFKPLSEQ